MKPFNLDDIIKSYYCGKSIKQLSKECGIGVKVLTRRLQEFGVKLRSRADAANLANTKVIPSLESLIERYQAGEPLTKLGAEVGVKGESLARHFRNAGVTLRTSLEARRARAKVIPTEVIERYKAGESLFVLAKEFGIARGRSGNKPTGLTRILIEAGVSLRGRSESQRNKWAKIQDPCRRRSQVEAALTARAIRHEQEQWKVAPTELCLAGALEALGIAFSPQKAVGTYNLDIALDEFPISIEVERGTAFSPCYYRSLFRRTEYLLNRGWAVLFVITGEFPLDVTPVTQKVVALLDDARSDKAIVGKYGVIDRHGERVSSPRYQFDTLTRIPGF